MELVIKNRLNYKIHAKFARPEDGIDAAQTWTLLFSFHIITKK